MLLVAHRTPPSAARCAHLAAAGARVFEIDVQLHAGRIAVSHFLPFAGGRLQRDNWRLRRRTSAIRDPALADVDAVVPSECAVLLDLKETTPHRRRELIGALIKDLPHRGRYVVCGPQPEDLEQARAAGFRTWRTVRRPRELDALLSEGAGADEAVSIRHSLVTEASLRRLRAVTEGVVAWTVNDRRRAGELRALGVDGVTTDRPAVLRLLAGAPPRTDRA